MDADLISSAGRGERTQQPFLIAGHDCPLLVLQVLLLLEAVVGQGGFDGVLCQHLTGGIKQFKISLGLNTHTGAE